MKKAILITLTILFISCNNQENKTYHFQKGGFINEKGFYYCKSINVSLKSYEDGTLTYGIFDKKNKLIYQQNMFSSFSNYQYWKLYVDEKENVWFYSSDIQQSDVLLKDSLLNHYVSKNFCNSKIKLPVALLKELSQSNVKFCW